MKNPTGKNIEKLVFGMFDQMVEGADKYDKTGLNLVNIHRK